MKYRILGMFLAVALGVGLGAGLLVGCGGNPYLDASLNPAELEGKDQAWFEKNWGNPTGKAPRFVATAGFRIEQYGLDHRLHVADHSPPVVAKALGDSSNIVR